jgi:hypothetical protein
MLLQHSCLLRLSLCTWFLMLQMAKMLDVLEAS